MNEKRIQSNAGTLFAHALELHQAGKLLEAEKIYKQVLTLDENHANTLTCLGTVHLQQGRLEEGIRSIKRSLEINPEQPHAHNNLGNAYRSLNRLDEALACYDLALALKPDYAEAHYNRGNTLLDLNFPEKALASYDRAIALRPDYAEAHYYRGYTLQNLNRANEALASYDRAIALRPDYAEAHYNLAIALQNLSRLDEALAGYDRVIALQPDYAEAHSNRANVLKNLWRPVEALASYDRAIALKPDLAEAFYGRGVTLRYLNRPKEALASYDRAIALKPDHAEAFHARGMVLQFLNRLDEALASYDRALSLKSDIPYLTGTWLHCKMQCCDWKNMDAAYARVINAIERGEKASSPFAILAIPSTLAQQQRCARTVVRDRYPSGPDSIWRGKRYVHDRIRIGYFSSDFDDHPVSHLIAHLIENHDHSRFEIIGFSFGPPPTNNAWHQRLERAFDSLIEVGTRTDGEIAGLARELEIDIGVDLTGHTQDARTGVFALRPAPLQLSYLGYIGTMGADYIDYLIADATVVPEAHRKYYDEKIVYLPHSYQANDSTKTISDRICSRAELGLPDDAFVFCCFNNNYKITPDLFDIWMRILRATDKSVLWLLEGNATAAKNLRLEAEKRGVSASRLVFATRTELPDYLARYRNADLFLDTFYYNAGATASDALWAGLPVVTCQGHTFASRMAASLVNAVGLPELVAHSHAEYENLASELAADPQRLAVVRQKLAINRTTHPLFDTANFTRDLETAYRRIHERYQAGLAPDHIVVDP